MTNQEHLEQMRELDDANENDCNCDYRQAKALEIIAETLISIDANIDYISNEVPTALNRR